jgi:hypothetical protein
VTGVFNKEQVDGGYIPSFERVPNHARVQMQAPLW